METDKRTIIIIVFVIIFLGIVYICVKGNVFSNWGFDKDYDAAWNLMIEGDYDAAENAIIKLSRNRDLEKYMKNSQYLAGEFCKICKLNKAGDYRKAYNKIDVLNSEIEKAKKSNDSRNKNDPRLNDKQIKFVEKKIIEINENYNAHKFEYDEEDRKKREEAEAINKKLEEERAAKEKEAPIVGMSESKIDSTDLGKHSEYYPNFNFKWEHGKKIQTSKYYWYSGNDCIYTAKCINGKVEEVWDNRDHHVTDNIFNTDSYTKKNSKKKEEKTTEFDPDEHDIEQYYEDFKDEEGFEDIDDAYEDFEDNPEYWDDY